MNTLQFIAWILVHIAIPIRAPIALLPVLALGRKFRSSATFSAVLVMLGAIDGLDASDDAERAEPSRIMVISILLTTASAVIFSVTHYLIDLT